VAKNATMRCFLSHAVPRACATLVRTPSSASRQEAMIASLIPWINRLSAGATVARIPPIRVRSPVTK
jgi:hypothetical protein